MYSSNSQLPQGYRRGEMGTSMTSCNDETEKSSCVEVQVEQL